MPDSQSPLYQAMLQRNMQALAQPTPDASNEQGVIGDTADLFQRGLGQTFGGDAETLGQLTDSQTIKNAGRAISDWGEGQLQELSPEMRSAMDKQFVVENPDGSISAGDAWADPRAYWGNFATVLGQFTGLIGGTKGAGVVAKPLIRGMANRLATDLVEGEAKRLVAKATVKDALKSGTMDSVRAAYAAAPSALAKKAVIDKAVGQLAFIGMGAHAGAMAAGMRAQQAERDTRTYLNSLSPDALNSNGDYQDAYWSLADGDMNGADPGEIRKAAISYLAEQTASDAFQDPRALASDFASGMLTGAGGGIGGVLGKVGQTRTGAAVRGLVGEGATEGWQGAETQRAVNEAVQEWADETRDPLAGVLVAGLNEAIIGGFAGGALAGVAGPEVHINKPVVRTVTGNERLDGGINQLDQRQAERGAAIEREIDTLFAGKQNPLGASSQAFDPVRDIPAYERQGFVKGSHDFRGTEIPGPLEGELLAPETGLVPLSDSTGLVPQGGRAAQELADLAGGRMPPSGRPAVADQRREGDLMPQELGQERAGLPGATIEGDGREVGTELPYRDFIVGEDGRPAQRRAADIARRGRELADQPAQIGQSDTIFVPGEPGADTRNSAYTPPRLSRDQVDRTLGEQSTRDPRSPVSQAIERAGSATDSVFGPLQSLRITRKGKPFASEKEALLASRANEMPVPLNGGGFGVAQATEVAKVQNATPEQPTSTAEDVALTAARIGRREHPLSTDAKTDRIAIQEQYLGQLVNDNPEQAALIAQQLRDNAERLSEHANVPEALIGRYAANIERQLAAINRRNSDGAAAAGVEQDGAIQQGEQAAGVPTEAELTDFNLLRERNGRWQYKPSVESSSWLTSNTKEGAIEQATAAHASAKKRGIPVLTRDERFEKANADEYADMDRRYGHLTMPELETRLEKLGGDIAGLQTAGSREMNGNGGRRTGAAVAAEGARQAGEERMKLGRYIERRKAAEPATPRTLDNATAPEHVTRGVDDRELGQIVEEFNAAQEAMRSDEDAVSHVFDNPAKDEVVRLNQKAKVYHKDHGWMTPAEAKRQIAEWRAHAEAQGKNKADRNDNSQRVVLSLFDLSGKWSQPWVDAGYQVYRFDIQDDPVVGDVNNFSSEFFSDWFGDFDGMDVYAILAATPCTDFASSGARHFAAKDKDGRTISSVKLVHQTLNAIEYFKPAVWALENPVGRIEKLGGLPNWRLSFDPNDVGDPYTKKTLIWGRFNADLPIAPVEPTEGSKMHSQYGGKSQATKNARSVTPEGFAYSFFMANNAIDNPALPVIGKYDRLDADLLRKAIELGVTEKEIDNAVEDYYYQDLDDDAANEAVQGLVDDAMADQTEAQADADSEQDTAPESAPAQQWGDATPDSLLEGMSKLFSGDMTYSEFRDFAERTITSGEAIKTMFGGWTVPRLKEYLTANNAYVFSGTKKAELVERATRIMQGEVRWPSAGGAGVLTTTTNPFAKSNSSPADALRAEVQGITEARYGEFVARRKELIAAHEARKEAIAKAVENPQTLDDYRTLVRMKGREGMTAEQVGEYERLLTEAQLDKQAADKATKQAAKLTATPSGDIIKTKHTKHGYDLFVVQMANRVEKDEYTRINAKAKEMGGWYSSFKGSGAVPGFQFKDQTQAADFRAWLTGQGQAESKPSVTADAPTVNMEEPASSPDDNVAKQIAGLRQRADTIRTKANAALAVDRKANTLRRAGMAARATAAAEEELKTADLLDAIADGVTTGKANILRNLTTKAQLATLRSRLTRAMYDLPNAEYERLKGEGLISMSSQGRYEWTEKASPLVRVEGAKMPGLDYWTRQLDDLASEMQASSNRSHKAAGVKLKNLAKAAEANQLRQVAVTDRDLIDKLTAFVRGSQEGTQAFRVAEQLTDADRLNKMGIFSRANLRAALVELQALEAGLGKRAEVSPLRTKEQALKLKLLGNRNAFIDFFPTTEDDAADLAGRLGIEPGMTVLEPSAGHGMLADAARDAGAKVDAVEIAGDLRDILTEKGYTLIGNDFMALTPTASYDAVIMNPPFSNGMDMDHVRHAYDFLKPGGRLAAIVSAGAGQQSTRKGQEFAAWLDTLGAEVELMREGAFKDSLNPTSVRTKIIVLEKPNGESTQAPSPEGKRVTVATPKGNAVEVQYRVVEAADLVTSHDFEGNINHNYPQQLQPRDRSKQTYRVQVGQLAAAPDGARLAASPETDRGAPIVSGLVVESGNGRSIGLKQAYQRGDADAYRRYIEANAADFGIDPALIGAMKQPVLVRERITTMTDEQLRDFVVDSNTDAKMANSAAEDAGADAGKLTDDMLDLLNIPEGGDVLASQNNRFLQAFLSAIGENQSNSYVSRDGQWNDAYRKRVTAAIFAYGYDNQRLLDAATGEVDADGRNITTALINNAVGMAKLRQHSPERANVVSNYLAEAVESIARAKRSGQSLQEMAAQSDMLGGETSQEGSLLAQAIAASARSAKAITGMVGYILAMLNKTTSADMFGAAVDPATPEEAINETLKAISAYNQQKASQPKPGGDLFGLAGARNNHGATPSVPRSGDTSAAKGASGVTEGRVELDGVSIRIPTFDEEQQRLYNQATHRGQGVSFASGISAGVGRILNDLKDAGLLETAEQKAAAEGEVQAWANEEAINARKLMRDGIKNPSWAITGRSGRKAQSSESQERENRRQVQHGKDQDARIKALRVELKKLRPKEVIGRESFNYAWGKAKAIIADYANAQSNNQPNLLASLRKSMNAELASRLQAMGMIDAPGLFKTLKEQDQRLKAAGYDGLVAIVGARSNPGKIIADAIEGRIRFSQEGEGGNRPAKGMTAKEAKVAATSWLKALAGATGIKLSVHGSQAEMEQALGIDTKAGTVRRAAFDADTGTLHLVAGNIDGIKHLQALLRHEVIAHYGLERSLGSEAYADLLARVNNSRNDKGLSRVWDWVSRNYPDADSAEQAEEVIAHLAELETSAWRAGWDSVVAWVKSALRAAGILPKGGVSDAEIRRLLAAATKHMGNTPDGGPRGGQPRDEQGRFTASEEGSKSPRFSQATVDSAMDKFNLGKQPDIIDKMKDQIDRLKQTDRATAKSWWDKLVKRLNTETLDALAPIKYAEDAAGITDHEQSGYVAARMASGSAATMQGTMLYGLPEWKDGVIQRKAGTTEEDALLGIFSALGKDLHNWLAWMGGNRAEQLMAEGRENLLTQDEIDALKALNRGKEAQFAAAKKKWNTLNKAVLDVAEEAGLFTADDRAKWESEWYVPFYRVDDDGDVTGPYKPSGIANQTAGIKRLKGSNRNTNDLLENIFQNTSKLIDASMKNMAAQKTVWNLSDTDMIEVIAKPNLMDWRALQNNRNMVKVKIEGEDYLIRVNDDDLYRAMTFFDRQPFGAGVRLMAKAKRLLTAGVTASPEFMLRNFLRDSLSSWAISKDGFTPVVDSIKGIRKTLAMDGTTIDVMFSGASFLGGYVNGNDPEAMADSIRKSLRRKGMSPSQIAEYEKSLVTSGQKVGDILGAAWDKYARVGEAIENANREAVYEAAIKAGKSHAQAAFEAKDLMDFSMLGASRLIQTAAMVLPFFNARIQGLGKLSREMRDNPHQIAKRAGMITAMSLALLAMNWDDERYKALPDWDKDANWHFWLGDEHFRIPKPFEIGVMFGTIPERMVRTLGGADTPEALGKAIARAFGETFALNPIPQAFKPAAEVYFNYDPFRGSPIENFADLQVQAQARYDENTSKLMRELGEMMGVSPKKLEHLLIGYTGTMGSYVMAAADGMISAATPGESAAWRADEIPLVKAVYRGSAPAKTSQYVTDFYRMLSEVNELKATVNQYRKEGRKEEAAELMADQGGILRARPALSVAQNQLRQLRNQIEIIQRDRVMSADQKRSKIDALLQRRNDIAAKVVERTRPAWE